MAESSSLTSDPEEKEDPLIASERNLESIRKTLEALDNLETRWKDVQRQFGETLSLALGGSLPSTLTDEEKLAVLDGSPTLPELCKRLKDGYFKKVIVMSGAGISVSAGIPDFRSPGSGLYDNIDLDKHGLPSPQAVFDIQHFQKDPMPFFSVVKQLLPGNFRPTPAHHFIKLLADKHILHRCYTQNIDGLERLAGLSEDLLVEAHGSLDTSKCTSCQKLYKAHEVKGTIMKDQIPKCSCCKDKVVRPCIVFFGEELPARFKQLDTADFAECDLLIVMGTSLKVLPFSGLINRVKDTTPRLLLNKERVGTFTLAEEGGYRDVAMLQDCDSSVRDICKQCGWSKDLERMVNPPKAVPRSTRPSGMAATYKKQTVSKCRVYNS